MGGRGFTRPNFYQSRLGANRRIVSRVPNVVVSNYVRVREDLRSHFYQNHNEGLYEQKHCAQEGVLDNFIKILFSDRMHQMSLTSFLGSEAVIRCLTDCYSSMRPAISISFRQKLHLYLS